MKEWKCVLCLSTYTGFGNNAEPVASGRCCDACNDTTVIKFRLDLLRLPIDKLVR